jgi:predicted transposase/invertase (TIGR01784 family)
MREKYINPFTDFGFKRLFGTEPNKDLLIDFLNTLLPREHQIKSLEYIRNERTTDLEKGKDIIFALYCKSEDDCSFIVQVQKVLQENFKDRIIYYSSFAFNEQGKREGWKREPVYIVSILDFLIENDEQENKVLNKVKFANVSDLRVVNDTPTYIYLIMPLFKKKEEELESHFDKWLFVLNNLSELTDRPAKLQEQIFLRLFEAAKLTPEALKECL